MLYFYYQPFHIHWKDRLCFVNSIISPIFTATTHRSLSKHIPSIIKQECIYREFKKYNIHNDPEDTLQCETIVYQI